MACDADSEYEKGIPPRPVTAPRLGGGCSSGVAWLGGLVSPDRSTQGLPRTLLGVEVSEIAAVVLTLLARRKKKDSSEEPEESLPNRGS